jgi:ketosteroid isomerase-like protein
MTSREIALAWLARFEACVRLRDFLSARELFSEEVFSFGSRVDQMSGLDSLESEQWRGVWSNIERFSFNLSDLRVHGTEQQGILVFGLSWTSLGIAPDESRFERPGRATLCLELQEDGSWRCVHSHFSLLPGSSGTLR